MSFSVTKVYSRGTTVRIPCISPPLRVANDVSSDYLLSCNRDGYVAPSLKIPFSYFRIALRTPGSSYHGTECVVSHVAEANRRQLLMCLAFALLVSEQEALDGRCRQMSSVHEELHSSMFHFQNRFAKSSMLRHSDTALLSNNLTLVGSWLRSNSAQSSRFPLLFASRTKTSFNSSAASKPAWL